MLVPLSIPPKVVKNFSRSALDRSFLGNVSRVTSRTSRPVAAINSAMLIPSPLGGAILPPAMIRVLPDHAEVSWDL